MGILFCLLVKILGRLFSVVMGRENLLWTELFSSSQVVYTIPWLCFCINQFNQTIIGIKKKEKKKNVYLISALPSNTTKGGDNLLYLKSHYSKSITTTYNDKGGKNGLFSIAVAIMGKAMNVFTMSFINIAHQDLFIERLRVQAQVSV